MKKHEPTRGTRARIEGAPSPTRLELVEAAYSTVHRLWMATHRGELLPRRHRDAERIRRAVQRVQRLSGIAGESPVQRAATDVVDACLEPRRREILPLLLNRLRTVLLEAHYSFAREAGLPRFGRTG